MRPSGMRKKMWKEIPALTRAVEISGLSTAPTAQHPE